MATIIDKLWIWGHLAGSYNGPWKFDCHMTPQDYAKEYGFKNLFLINFENNLQPPFDEEAKKLAGLSQIKWSVLGDGGSTLHDDGMHHTQGIIDVLPNAKNVTGGVVDDFFCPLRVGLFPPEKVQKIQQDLHANGLDFWCVVYEHNLEDDIQEYFQYFDGVTFWFQNQAHAHNLDARLKDLRAMAGDLPIMVGTYVWDFWECKEKDPALFEVELQHLFDLIQAGEIDGAVVCSNAIGDADLETNRVLKRMIAEQGGREIVSK